MEVFYYSKYKSNQIHNFEMLIIYCPKCKYSN